jgi:hypothetical protein
VTKIDKVEIHHTGVQDAGFPIETTISSAGRTSKTEITELSTAPVDPALFEFPAGYKQVARLKGGSLLPPRSKLLRVLGWLWRSLGSARDEPGNTNANP